MKPLQIAALAPGVFVLVWSSGYVVGALGTEVVAPETITLWRFLGAAAVLAVIAGVRRERWPRGTDIARVAAVGVLFFGVQFAALYYGMSVGVPASTTALVACSAPLVVAVVSARLGWETLTRRQWQGVALGLGGVVLTLADRVGRPPHLVDLGWTLLGLVGLAAGTLLHGRLRVDAGAGSIATFEVLGGAAPMAVLAPLTGSLSVPLSVHAVGSMLWLTLATGVGGPLLMFALIRQRGATATISLLFVVPAVTAIAAWPVLGTPLSVTAVAGLLVAGMGLLLLTVLGARPRVEVEVSGERQIQSGYVGSGSGPVDWSRVCSSARPTA
jgi:drug/metabolite transporter (DMT)-like permease